MEKHILTYASSGTAKTVVTITRIRNEGTNVIGEVIYTGTDEGAVILDDIMEHPVYNHAIKELKELRAAEERRRERTIQKVEQALGLKLYDWQKAFIFYNKPYGKEISDNRRNGKTLAHCLRLCLSDGEPIHVNAKNEFLQYLGEDGNTIRRSKLFIYELRQVYNQLLEAGNIDLREIIFLRR